MSERDDVAPPVWADALRFQLLGLVILVAAGLIALGTLGVVSMLAEIVAVAGVAVALFGFYAWPRSPSNNS